MIVEAARLAGIIISSATAKSRSSRPSKARRRPPRHHPSNVIDRIEASSIDDLPVDAVVNFKPKGDEDQHHRSSPPRRTPDRTVTRTEDPHDISVSYAYMSPPSATSA